MDHNFGDVLTLLAAISAAISSFVAAWKSHKAARIALAVQSTQAAIALANRERQAPPAAEVPAASINDVLRYWDLASKIAAAWVLVRTLPAHVPGSLPLIKARMNGRHVRIGPTPIEFED